MNTSVRARHDARGFSFIELLVTIIIAGIAFAALVPVFVAAQQKGAGDSARNVALSLARDKLEKIREVDYDQIYEDNLNSSTWFGGGFGHSVSVSGGGGAKDYIVDYSVVFVGGQWDGRHDVKAADATSSGHSETYKQVTVTAYWTGNPKPVKRVVLSTSIYKQYQGSRIDDLIVEGLHGGVSGADASRQFVTATPVTFTAWVNDADASRTSKVTFLVYNTSGLVATLTCLAADSANGKYQVTWDPGAPVGSLDGVYTIKATAANTNGYAVNTVATTFSLETGSPPQVGGVTATGYSHAINLSWSNTSAADVATYYVWRMNPPTPTAVAPTYPSTPTYQIPFKPSVTPTVADTNLDTNGYQNNDPFVYPGNSDYRVYYEIVAVDSVGNESVATYVSAIPHLPYDYVHPTTPTNFAGSVTPSQAPPLWVTLTWGFSTDPPTPGLDPTSGMNGYRVYRKDGSGPWTLITTVPHVADTVANPDYSWTDSSLKPVDTYEYYIAAIDNVYNESAPTATLTFTTPNYLYNNVLVENTDKSSGYYVMVTNTDGTAIDTWPGPSGPTTNPLPSTPLTQLSKQNNGVKDSRHIYLPVGLTFKVSYQSTKNGGPWPWSSKIVTIASTTTVSINGSVFSVVDIP